MKVARSCVDQLVIYIVSSDIGDCFIEDMALWDKVNSELKLTKNESTVLGKEGSNIFGELTKSDNKILDIIDRMKTESTKQIKSKKRINELESEISLIKDRICAAEKEGESDNGPGSLMDELTKDEIRFTEELVAVKKDLASSEDRTTELELDLSEEQSHHDTLKEEHDALEKKYKAKEAEVSKLQAQSSILKEKKDMQEAKFSRFIAGSLTVKVEAAEDNKGTFVSASEVNKTIKEAFRFIGVDSDEFPPESEAYKLCHERYTLGYYGVAQKTEGKWRVLNSNPLYEIVDKMGRVRARVNTKLKACEVFFWGPNSIYEDHATKHKIPGINLDETLKPFGDYKFVRAVNAISGLQCDSFMCNTAYTYYLAHHKDTPEMEVIL